MDTYRIVLRNGDIPTAVRRLRAENDRRKIHRSRPIYDKMKIVNSVILCKSSKSSFRILVHDLIAEFEPMILRSVPNRKRRFDRFGTKHAFLGAFKDNK